MKPIKIHKDQIKVGDRIRKDLGDLQSLADSIKEVGLIQAVVIDEQYNLIAGGRRFTAMTQLLKWDEIPVTMNDVEGSEAKLRMMELEENVRRKEMTWQEKVFSIAKVHKLRKKEAILGDSEWTQKQTGELLGVSTGNVSYSLEIARLLLEPAHPVLKAESLTHAFQILLQLREDALNSQQSSFLAKAQKPGGAQSAGATLSIDELMRGEKVTPKPAPEGYLDDILGGLTDGAEQPKEQLVIQDSITVELSKYFILGDSIEVMKTIPTDSIDHIVTDPPYGIDMDNLEQEGTGMDVSRTADEHQVAPNIVLLQHFLEQAFRIIKPGGFCVFWYDLDHHEKLQSWAKNFGFKVQRWPLVWAKTHRCINQAAQYNFTKATEVAMVLRKGQSTLVQPQGLNYYIGSNEADREKFSHPFVKPEALWKWIHAAVAIKGQTILDPFAGVGSCPLAAVKGGFNPMAIELKDVHYNRMIVEMKALMSTWLGPKAKEVIFV